MRSSPAVRAGPVQRWEIFTDRGPRPSSPCRRSRTDTGARADSPRRRGSRSPPCRRRTSPGVDGGERDRRVVHRHAHRDRPGADPPELPGFLVVVQVRRLRPVGRVAVVLLGDEPELGRPGALERAQHRGGDAERGAARDRVRAIGVEVVRVQRGRSEVLAQHHAAHAPVAERAVPGGHLGGVVRPGAALVGARDVLIDS